MTAPEGEVTTPMTSGRNGIAPLALGREEPLGLQRLASLFQHRHQRPDPGWLQRLDHDLVLGLAGKGREATGRDDLQPLLDLRGQLRGLALPDHPGQGRAIVLEVQIDMARTRPGHPPELAAHAHAVEISLDRALHRARQLRDGELRRIAAGQIFEQVVHPVFVPRIAARFNGKARRLPRRPPLPRSHRGRRGRRP